MELQGTCGVLIENIIGSSISWSLGMTWSTKERLRRADPLDLPSADALHHGACLARLLQDTCEVMQDICESLEMSG